MVVIIAVHVAISRDLIKKLFQINLMADSLQKEIADVSQNRRRSGITAVSYFLIKADFNLHSNFLVFLLFVVFSHHPLCINEGIIGNGKQLRMFTDPLDSSGSSLPAISNTLLNVVNGGSLEFLL